MTMAKIMFAMQVVSIVRRAWDKMFLLAPDKQHILQNAIGYFYAVAVDRYDITPHVFMTMCNHYHCVQTDTMGNRGYFMSFFHGEVAKYINSLYGRSGSVWDPNDKPGDQWLVDHDSIEQKILYTLMNPVRAGIISKLEDWEHFKITPDDWGNTLTFTKPPDLEGPNWPPIATLNPVPPAEFDSLNDPTAHFNTLIDLRTQVIHNDRQRVGARFGTMEECFTLNPADTPESLDAKRRSKKHTNPGRVITYTRLKTPAKRMRSKNNPTFLASTADLQADVRKGKREFNSHYRDARELFKDDKDTVFPFGTYKLRVDHNVNVDDKYSESIIARIAADSS